MSFTITVTFPNECRPSCGVTASDLHQLENRIMSAISDYAERVNASFTAIEAATDNLSTHVAGVQADVTALKALIEQLQNTPGTPTPEDLEALDAATEPPPTPPTT